MLTLLTKRMENTIDKLNVTIAPIEQGAEIDGTVQHH
jgi:hypothetical protein